MLNIYKKVIGVVVVLILILILILTVDSSKNYNDLKKQLKSSFLVHNSNKELVQFSLVDHNDNKFNNERFKGKWTLLLFIYTHCPDVCPTELMDMSSLRSSLLNSNSKAVPNIVAVTFDPIRDTPEMLKTYVSHFNKDFIGVSGDQKQVDKLVRSLGAYYERVFKNKEGKEIVLRADESLPEYAIKNGYLINHTARIYLISPKGQAFASFPTPRNIKNMASDINLIIENY